MAVKWVKIIRQILITLRGNAASKSLGYKVHCVTVTCSLTQYSTVLPRMPRLHKNARKSWHGALIDEDMERLLELKWNRMKPRLKELHPMKTAGDGNRLLEAICLSIWGFHDISAVLRDDIRTATNDDNFRTRWQNKQEKRNHVPSTATGWEDEWRKVLQRTQSSDDLWEDIHVFVLAQMLYRPIIVMSDDDQLAGIYLPLDHQPEECVKTPIVLAHSRYFVPLVTMETAADDVTLSGVPLVNFGSAQPVIQFLRPEEEPEGFALLQRYLDVACAPTDDGTWIPVAKLYPIKLDPEIDRIDQFCRSYDEENEEDTTRDMLTCEVEMCNSEPRRQPSALRCEVSNKTDEEDICSYPRCEKPAKWWPFCYEHSPDSGWAPGGLLHEHNKWTESKRRRRDEDNTSEHEVEMEEVTDEITICVGPMCGEMSDADCNGLCRGCHDTLYNSRTPSLSGASTDTDEEDNCSYPRCEKPAPEPWWPFCYEHSPDSGLAPGGLLHDYNKWTESKRNY